MNEKSTNNNLPAASTRVVGRNEIIDQILREVKEARLISIVGAGGIGKTTVALAIAEQAAGSFKDGVWLVDFAPLQDRSLVANAIASVTGLVVHSANTMAALCRFLRDRNILLVLDNCEHINAAVASCVTRILNETFGVHVIATSRSSLRVPGEIVHRLPGLATPAVSSGLTAEKALTFPAIELFVERATDRLETFTLGDPDAPVVAEICTSLDGIALAIELAAMRVDAFGVRGLQRQLNDRFSVLSGRRGGLKRHRTLAATLDWSYGLLSPGEATLLRAVSSFAGAFRVSDALAVADMPIEETGTMLGELASKSLLTVDSDAEDTCYRPLETTRAYCLEKLLVSGEDQVVRLRHAEHICAVLERAAGEWERQQSTDWGAAHARYLDDLRAALCWVGTQASHRLLLIRLTAAGTLLWNHFSLTDESRGHLSRAIAELNNAGVVGTSVEMHLQFALAGALIYTRGIVAEAREAMARALDISEQIGDGDFRLRCLRLIATYEIFIGEHHSSIETLQSFLSLAAVVDPSALPEGETHLGLGEIMVGRLRDARKRMEALHENSSRDLNDARFARYQYSNSVNILVVLSHAQWLTGAPEAAMRTADLAVEYGVEAKHELSLSIALAWACLTCFWLSRDDECSRHLAMLDELVERHGIVTWRPLVTFFQAAVASRHRDGRPLEIDKLEGAIKEFRSIRHMARLPYYIGVLAETLTKNGQLERAKRVIQEAFDCATRQKERWCLPELMRIQASIAFAQGRIGDAQALLIGALDFADEIGALSWKLRVANDLAYLWQGQSRQAEAKRMLHAIYGAFTEGFKTYDLMVAAGILGDMK